MATLLCCKTGCTPGTPATHFPVIRLRPKGYQGPPAETIFNLPCCESCALGLKIDDVISDEGWARICAVMAGLKKAQPERSLTMIGIKPLSEIPQPLIDRALVRQEGGDPDAPAQESAQ